MYVLKCVHKHTTYRLTPIANQYILNPWLVVVIIIRRHSILLAVFDARIPIHPSCRHRRARRHWRTLITSPYMTYKHTHTYGSSQFTARKYIHTSRNLLVRAHSLMNIIAHRAARSLVASSNRANIYPRYQRTAVWRGGRVYVAWTPSHPSALHMGAWMHIVRWFSIHMLCDMRAAHQVPF